ncbi:DUF1549 and DUF1553 domain-containing protein [Fuerstiella marisgermanici]|uniref:BIG2 domain-containing protein n=1 Tax=Fuerstiella marisgermanici TaxID=1891926 RepID=A0A1P8WH33_9PLAN|nr:DUF1549 and DUF1553 domain-containing protein [Fuerstiella marisgermanici]APZ93386.1 hypothetical protein Fuma_03003 [Fuerstiella marisgermanici]
MHRSAIASRFVGRCRPFFALCLFALCGTWLWGAETLPPANQRYETEGTSEIPDFQRHVVPLLGRLGCNGRNCHGSFQGRGDFRLSLFGYDFKMDHQGLLGRATAAEGQRIDRRNPSNSLILKKPTIEIDHEGGERFARGSWEYQLLHRWIETGAEKLKQPQELDRLELFPNEILFRNGSESAQLQVIAIWTNGDREDVTPLCRFRANDDSVAMVDQDGVVSCTGSGDTHIIAFYDNGIGSVPVIRPTSSREYEPIEIEETIASIDRFVAAKLNKLHIMPSPQCSDAEFLRRVSIDLTGTLPPPQEVREFLSDPRKDKRTLKINELLDRPAYAAWWTNKLCDYTGCNPRQQAELGQELSVQWYMWIVARLKENVPYDEIVRRIVLAQGRSSGQSFADYTRETSSYFQKDYETDFADRQTMPHYWTRRSMEEPQRAAEAFAHNFLGVRLQCAQCHKHPFAQWTQKDYRDFSRFFETVKFGVKPDDLAQYRDLAKRVGMNVRSDDGSPVRNDAVRRLENGTVYPWRELYIKDRGRTEQVNLLRSGSVSLGGQDDPRQPIMAWMSDPENPWFAKAFVNRVWSSYFHQGIVDPPDDLNPANPPSHPKLLDSLTKRFVENQYDMKWLHREIVSSETYQRSCKPSHNNHNDRKNFSRAIPRRMPAEVVYDSVKQIVAASDQEEEVRTDLTRRASGHLSMRLAGTYAMQIFGKPERAVNCDCERNNHPTLLQAVFLQNDPIIEQRIESSGWLAEITAAESANEAIPMRELVEEAWLRALCRLPNKIEIERSLSHLGEAESVSGGMQDLLWALINTKEFLLIK